MPEESRRAAVYCRISLDRDGAGLGVERQKADCLALAEQLGARVVAVHTDNDVSAYSRKRRPGYELVLDDIKQGRVDLVLVWNPDRLHRRPRELESYIELCEAAGVITHTVRAGLVDLATPAGRMIARQLGAVARYESENRGARVAAARRQRVEAGRFGGGIRAFGFEADGTTVRPCEAGAIARATEAILAGASLRSIVHDWNGRGITTSRGKAWTATTLRDVLVRARNAGLLVHRDELVGSASWPALVPEESWRAICALFRDPNRRSSPGNTVSHLGSFLYRCGVCHQPKIVCSTAGSRRNGRRRRPAYRCRWREGSGGSHHVVRDQASVDRLVVETVLARLGRADAVDLLCEPSPGVDVAALRAEGLGLSRRLTDISEAFAAGEITRAQLASATEKMRARQAEIDDELSRSAQTSPLTAVVGSEDVRATWEGLELSRRRAVVDTLVTVTILPSARGPKFDPSTIDIDWKS